MIPMPSSVAQGHLWPLPLAWALPLDRVTLHHRFSSGQLQSLGSRRPQSLSSTQLQHPSSSQPQGLSSSRSRLRYQHT